MTTESVRFRIIASCNLEQTRIFGDTKWETSDVICSFWSLPCASLWPSVLRLRASSERSSFPNSMGTQSRIRDAHRHCCRSKDRKVQLEFSKRGWLGPLLSLSPSEAALETWIAFNPHAPMQFRRHVRQAPCVPWPFFLLNQRDFSCGLEADSPNF
jgi:hypothetical protein